MITRELTIGKKRAVLAEIENTVLDVQSRTETSQHTTSSGGGGHVHEGTGYISPIQTQTRVESVTIQRIFLRSESGEEWHLDVGAAFAVRRGNRIISKIVDGLLVGIVNTDSNKYLNLNIEKLLPTYWVELTISLFSFFYYFYLKFKDPLVTWHYNWRPIYVVIGCLGFLLYIRKLYFRFVLRRQLLRIVF